MNIIELYNTWLKTEEAQGLSDDAVIAVTRFVQWLDKAINDPDAKTEEEQK